MKKNNCCIIGMLLAMFLLVNCARGTRGEKIQEYGQEKTALVVIDIQHAFSHPSEKLAMDSALSQQMMVNTNRLIERFNQASGEIFYVVMMPDTSNFFIRLLLPMVGIKDKSVLRIDDRLTLVSKDIFVKSKGDAFSSKPFEQALVERKINKLYVAGLAADGCIKATVEGARNRGYAVVIVDDAIAVKKSAVMAKMINLYTKMGAAIASTDQVVAGLNL